MSILNFLRSDGSIVVNKHLARTIGLNEAIILSELISWHMYYTDRGETDDEGMFFVTIDKLEENTTIKKDTQNRAIKKLIDLDLIVTKQKGLPAKRYFWINEETITQLVVTARSGVASKPSQNAKPDNRAGSKAKKAEKVDNSQVSQNANTGSRNLRNPAFSKSEGINTNNINTDLSNTKEIKEDEDSTHTPAAFSGSRLIEKDIQKLEEKYPEYKKVTEAIGANALANRRPVLAEEEYFIEQAAAIPVHPETLMTIYQAVQTEIDRSSGFAHAYELIENVFERFARHLRKGRINFDAAAWFHTTWFNERISIEQADMLNE